jgi:hypothetical protein
VAEDRDGRRDIPPDQAAQGRSGPPAAQTIVCQPGRNGKGLIKEVLSMRLGKEQAVGYVEDTEADSLTAEELAIGQPDGMPVIAVPESPLAVS